MLLDFGKGFSRRAKYFEEYLSPKIANGIVDFIGMMGLIPDVVRAFTETMCWRCGRASAMDRGGPEELADRRKKGIHQLLFFIASSGAGRLRPNPKPEPGDIVLHDAHGKIGSYSYFTVFAALANLIFLSSREILGQAGALTHVAY
jgi:hypothetical protein